MATSPIEQFKVKNIGGDIFINNVNISFSNSALFMAISSFIIIVFYYIALKKEQALPSKVQMFAEVIYDFVYSIVKDNINSEKAILFFPFIFALFLFLLVGNVIGVFPLSFAFTAQIAITLFISFFILFLATIYGIYLHGLKFFKLFLPDGLPPYLIPLMVILEVISYIAKAISMGVRIFANIMAGHILVKVIGGFILTLGVFGIVPFTVTVGLFAFELAIAFIQAYVFAILTCLAFNQAINLH